MARRPRTRDRARRHQALRPDMTPMIDVTFLLLVFFMCTLQFQTLEGLLAANLPKDAGAGARNELVERTQVTLAVANEGTRLHPHADRAWSGAGPFRYGADRELEYTVGPRRTRDLGAAADLLAALRRNDPELEIVLRPRDGVVHGDVVALIDRAREVGIERISFAAAR